MFENIQEWYMQLQGSEHTFWTIAIIASVVFLIQALLTMVGMDAHTDIDFDFHDGDTMDTGGAVSLFSIRSLVNFFVGFGWAGVTFIGTDIPVWLVYIIAIAVGVAFAYLYIYMRRKMMKFEHNGAFKIADCLGMEADVYLRIPAQRSGRGKVQVSINGSVQELDAVTEGDTLPSGSRIKVTAVEGSILVVENIHSGDIVI